MVSKKIVIVVGGGYGGIQVARGLDSKFNVILIDRKNYFLHNVGMLRALTVPGWVDGVLIPYNNLLQNGCVIFAQVTNIQKDYVQVHGSEEKLKFDYLVIATGTSYALPSHVARSEKQEAKKMFEDELKELQKGNHVIIAGGGPVGYELAGEIKDAYPSKQVTLVQAGSALVSATLPSKFRSSAQKKIEKMGVKVILNQFVLWEESVGAENAHSRVARGQRDFKLSSGEIIQADLAYFCARAKVNSLSYRESLPVNRIEQLKVNSHLQVEGCTNIFAVGDCTNLDESKLAYHAGFHARVVVHNVIALDAGKSLKEYKVNVLEKMILPAGSHGGVKALGPRIVAFDFIIRRDKAKDLFRHFAWNMVGIKGIGGSLKTAKTKEELQEYLRSIGLPEEIASVPSLEITENHT